MKLRFSKKDKLIIALIFLLIVLLIVFAQFYSLSPLKSELAGKKMSLETEQKLLETVSQKKAAGQNIVVDTMELQKRMPVKPLQEQLILDLEKAETLSNSQIKSMSFSKDADANAASTQTNMPNTSGGQTTAGNVNSSNQTTAADPNMTNQGTSTQGTGNQQAAASLPAGVKKLTVSLNVESPSYEDLERFIATLESLKRIVVVESINYSGGQEITSLSQENQSMNYSLTISVFYMPNLADLQAQLPKIDAPPPANKENPLAAFSDITKQPD